VSHRCNTARGTHLMKELPITHWKEIIQGHLDATTRTTKLRKKQPLLTDGSSVTHDSLGDQFSSADEADSPGPTKIQESRKGNVLYLRKSTRAATAGIRAAATTRAGAGSTTRAGSTISAGSTTIAGSTTQTGSTTRVGAIARAEYLARKSRAEATLARKRLSNQTNVHSRSKLTCRGCA